jgi:hypothetical protein
MDGVEQAGLTARIPLHNTLDNRSAPPLNHCDGMCVPASRIKTDGEWNRPGLRRDFAALKKLHPRRLCAISGSKACRAWEE